MIQLLAKPLVEQLNLDTAERVKAFSKKYGRVPCLSVVLVGKNPGSVIYTTKKGDAAVAVGMDHETIAMPDSTTPAHIKASVEKMNLDKNVDGILIQRPLPSSFKEEDVLTWVSPDKDVDGFHPSNVGKLSLGIPSLHPCTPAGVMKMLEFYKINPRGKIACVIGRSAIVGKPMAALLLQADATVFHCHSKTPDLTKITTQADIIVVAIGKEGFLKGEHVKQGAIVIDVGINRSLQGKVVGDVLYSEVSAKASAITPVPGGVGPLTIAMLLQNTMKAAEMREEALANK